MALARGSVSRRHRGTEPAEPIVQAHGDHVNVLADPVVEYRRKARIDHGEGVVCMSHPQMVIFNPERPVGREAIFKANTQGTAPASVICRDQTDPRGVVEYSQAIAGDSRTALHIEQRRIPSPTELAGEETDGVGLCRGRERRIEQAHARVLDVGPIALSFQSEYKLIGLPAISNLSTGNASGTVTAAARDSPHSSDEIHATMALAP